MTPAEYGEAMMLFRAYWPQHQSTQAFFAAGERQLLDLDFGLVVAALDALAVESPRFPPGLGEVRSRAIALGLPEPPDPSRAWGEVTRAIAHEGHTGRPIWSNPAIGIAIDALGGWRCVCLSENQMADRAHFLKLYADLVGRDRTHAALPRSVRELSSVARLVGLDLSAERSLEPGSG